MKHEVVELTDGQIEEVNGGILIYLLAAAAVLVFAAGAADGYNDAARG